MSANAWLRQLITSVEIGLVVSASNLLRRDDRQAASWFGFLQQDNIRVVVAAQDSEALPIRRQSE